MKIGIVGCTGAVGYTLLELMSQHYKKYEINCYASSKSKGKILLVGNQYYPVEEFSVNEVNKCDVVFLCVSGSFSKEYGKLLSRNTYVVDNSSFYRCDDETPLLVPQINGNIYKGERLVSNPNCSSAIALMVLGPLHREYGIENLIISTYQAASGAGKSALEEIKARVLCFKDYDRDLRSQYFVHDLAFNVVPQISAFQDNGYTYEEMKLVWEIRKVLAEPNLNISATAVRVPTLRSHAQSVTIKLVQPVKNIDSVRDLLRKSPGVEVRDEPLQNLYPMPKTSTYNHNVEVGRIRHNLIYGEQGLDLFISGDQLLRGAALNAFDIFKIIEKYIHNCSGVAK